MKKKLQTIQIRNETRNVEFIHKSDVFFFFFWSDQQPMRWHNQVIYRFSFVKKCVEFVCVTNYSWWDYTQSCIWSNDIDEVLERSRSTLIFIFTTVLMRLQSSRYIKHYLLWWGYRVVFLCFIFERLFVMRLHGGFLIGVDW